MTPYYADASVTLYHGDCREVFDQVAPFADHCITDPPYAADVYLRMRAPDSKEGSGTLKRLRSGSALVKMANGAIGVMDDELMRDVGTNLGALIGRWVIVFSDVESCHRWRDALVRGSLQYIRTGAWVKPDAMPQMSGDRPAVGFEPATIVHGCKLKRWNGGGHPALWTHYIAKGAARPDHPCPKPESLMLELVAQFTDEGETILDPFAGSGTTLLAAKRLGRRAIGIEREERYCEVIARRLQQGALEMWDVPPAGDAVDPALSARGTDSRARAGDLDL